MKKFKYRLEPLLKIREQKEQDCQKRHAEATIQVHNQEEQNESVETCRQETMAGHREHLHGRLTVDQLLLYSRYQHKLKREGLAGQEMLRALRKEAEERRHELMEAARERKKYEKLKERLAEKHAKTALEQERKESDETALNTHRRKHKS